MENVYAKATALFVNRNTNTFLLPKEESGHCGTAITRMKRVNSKLQAKN